MSVFLRFFFAVLLVALGAVAVTAYLVDPYGYWDRPRIDGFNYWKPYAGRHVRDTKKRQYLWVRPKVVLAGNSRIEAGFDPASDAWPTSARPVYNFGIRGARMETVANYLLEAMDKAPPERIYLAVDFTDFLVSPQAWRSATHPAPAPGNGPVRQAGLAGTMLFSLDALKDSLLTVAVQNGPSNKHLSPLGFNPLRQFVPMVREEGHRRLFDATLRQVRDRYAKKGSRVSWPQPGANPAWLAVEKLAERSRRRGVELVLFTYPYHVEMLELFEELGLAAAHREWTCDLAGFSARHGVAVWNFTAVNAVTAEPIPPRGDHRPMRHWWEIGHFKTPVGDLMIRRMTQASGDFGRRLAPAANRTCQDAKADGAVTLADDGAAPL